MSVAARVQARRVERASEAARTYVDAIRTGAIPATSIEEGTAFTPTRGSTPFLNAARVPTSADFPTQVDWTTDSGFYCVDLDQNRGCSKSSPNDLVIQGFRTRGDAEQGYRLGVRVYRADAFRGTRETLQREQQAALKGNLGSRLAPLATLITDIPPKEKNLGSWCNRLRQTSPDPNRC